MSAADTDQYFTYEARLNSFQKITKKRGSTAGGRAAKALNWPHKQISPASLARAGFFFRPSPESPDNTVCFLCEKGLDGWEAGDDPLVEHVKHAPHCGWAVVAAIEADIDDYGKEDPNQPDMIEARKATFGGRWPHDNKKGWKCKTKQLVEAGWKYTPTIESNDMATCTYCQLALDGWEPNDKPLDEHYNRSPSCPFFILTEQYKGASKNSRSKALSSSKASRLSVQSVGTVVSETTALTDQTASPEDSVLTTASVMTQQGAKKPRAKKAIAAKGPKKKTKKEEASEIHEETPPVEDSVVSQSQSLPPQTKTKRGKKRGSEAVEESILSTTDGPASKKRVTRTPASTVDNSSVVDDADMTDAPSKTSGHKKTLSSSKLKPAQQTPEPQASPSNASVASLRAPPGSFPDDDEIERQLEADLERQFSDEEIAQDSDSERSKAKAKKALAKKEPEKEATPPPSETSAAYAMFNPNAPEPDEATIDDELKALQAEMEVTEPEPELQVPQKTKAGTRKSKQSKGKKSITELSPPELEGDTIEVEVPLEEEEQEEEHEFDMTVGSTETVLKKKVRRSQTGKRGQDRPSTASFLSVASMDEIEEEVEVGIAKAAVVSEPPVKRGRGRPAKTSLASQFSNAEEDVKPTEGPVKRGRGRPSKASLVSQDLEAKEIKLPLVPAKKGRGRPPKTSLASQEGGSINVTRDGGDLEPQTKAKRARGRPSKKSIDTKPMEEIEVVVEQEERANEPEPIEDVQEHDAKSPTPVQKRSSLDIPPSTPIKVLSPAPSARQPVLSPSQSPQSSDAENQPPSSRLTAPATTKKVVLAPVTATPMRGSPSKRNVLTGLQSTIPWASANIDTIFGTPRPGGAKETGVERFLKQGKDLTSPEKGMTVEEWIYFNANEAEKKLKHECETLVSRFESEGTRAINVLEGLEVE